MSQTIVQKGVFDAREYKKTDVEWARRRKSEYLGPGKFYYTREITRPADYKYDMPRPKDGDEHRLTVISSRRRSRCPSNAPPRPPRTSGRGGWSPTWLNSIVNMPNMPFSKVGTQNVQRNNAIFIFKLFVYINSMCTIFYMLLNIKFQVNLFLKKMEKRLPGLIKCLRPFKKLG